MSTDSLVHEANQLSVAERLRLVEEIWDSIDDDPASLPLSAEQRNELDSRLEDFQANPSVGDSWDEVRRRIERGKN